MSEAFDIQVAESATIPSGLLTHYYKASAAQATYQIPARMKVWQEIREKLPIASGVPSNTLTAPFIDHLVFVRLDSSRNVVIADVQGGKQTYAYFLDRENAQLAKENVEAYLAQALELKTKNWVDRFSTPIHLKHEGALKYAVSQLQRISALEENWDGEGAKKIASATIARCVTFFTRLIDALQERGKDIGIPSIGALPDGGIEFEFENFFKTLIFSIPESADDKVSYYMNESTLFKDIESEGEASEEELVEVILSGFIP